MKVGAEPAKIAILAVLLSLATYLVYNNFLASANNDVTAPAAVPAARALPPPPVPQKSAVPARSPASRRTGAGSQEWVPSLAPRRPEDRVDPATIDPTLRLDLLAKLESVTMSGGDRSLFEFAQPKAPKAPEPKIMPTPVQPVEAPKPVDPPKPADPVKPPPPPIPLKFYGFVNGSGGRRAFFINGEEILVGGEGETLQSRYKIIRIGLSSAVVEDTQLSNQQTLPLETVPAG